MSEFVYDCAVNIMNFSTSIFGLVAESRSREREKAIGVESATLFVSGTIWHYLHMNWVWCIKRVFVAALLSNSSKLERTGMNDGSKACAAYIRMQSIVHGMIACMHPFLWLFCVPLLWLLALDAQMLHWRQSFILYCLTKTQSHVVFSLVSQLLYHFSHSFI